MHAQSQILNTISIVNYLYKYMSVHVTHFTSHLDTIRKTYMSILQRIVQNGQFEVGANKYTRGHWGVEESANNIYQPLCSSRIWHKVNFYAKFNRFEFRVTPCNANQFSNPIHNSISLCFTNRIMRLTHITIEKWYLIIKSLKTIQS